MKNTLKKFGKEWKSECAKQSGVAEINILTFVEEYMTKETLKHTDINNDMVVNVFVKIGLPEDGSKLDQKATTKERNHFENELKKVELAQGIIPC